MFGAREVSRETIPSMGNYREIRELGVVKNDQTRRKW